MRPVYGGRDNEKAVVPVLAEDTRVVDHIRDEGTEADCPVVEVGFTHVDTRRLYVAVALGAHVTRVLLWTRVPEVTAILIHAITQTRNQIASQDTRSSHKYECDPQQDFGHRSFRPDFHVRESSRKRVPDTC